MLDSEYLLCKEGAVLTTDQAHLARLLNVTSLAVFGVEIVKGWKCLDGSGGEWVEIEAEE